MPPALTWPDLAGRRVGVWGLGVEGRASLARLAAMGLEPAAVVDERAPDRLSWDDGGAAALAGCDVVLKAPGISRHGPQVLGLEAAGIAVVGGLALWLQGHADSAGPDAPAAGRVLCITGTKGKSTTTAIAGHLLTGLGVDAFLGGNFGAPPWDPSVGAHDVWVLETSSYQAADLTCSPPVVAVTSLHQDHLDWHGDDAETYYRDKLSVCRHAGATLTVANGDSDLLRERRELLGPVVEWIGAADPAGAWVDALGLPGAHNRRNALIAAAALRALRIPGAAEPDALLGAAQGFAGLESRLRTIGSIDGVQFVDDSLSTNVLPTCAALDAFPGRRVALIVGGHDRGIDYAPLGVALASRAAPTTVLTLPDNGPRIRAAISSVPGAPPVADAADLRAAVATAHAWARPDGVVLLSPAASSFGRYADYRDRAADFRAAFEARQG